MQKLILFFLTCFATAAIHAQVNKRSALFDFVNQNIRSGMQFSRQNFIENATVFSLLKKDAAVSEADAVRFSLNNILTHKIFQDRQAAIILSIPFINGKSFELQLVQQKINSSNDFSFGEITPDGSRKNLSADEGLHYRGCIAGDSSSIASISFFANGDLIGLFSNSLGNFIIGKMENSNEYVVYNSSSLVFPRGIGCSTDDSFLKGAAINNGITEKGTLSVPPTLCRKVRFYWEGDYSLYRYNFSSNIINVQNYITGLFNQVATLYQNEGITVELAEAYIWTVADPYRNSSSSNALADFKSRWNNLGNNFNGDIAHLISGGVTNNGGVAYINVLCNRFYGYGYSNVYASYKTYPAYSWDLNELAHELGHNFGSQHTQWCGWNTGAGGTCGAIDNCAALESGSSCSTCPATTQISTRPPGWSGTVMSYCHLVSGVGVNLANGFGPLPQAVIRTSATNGSCLVSDSYWTGAVDTLWSDAGNWSCGKVPDANTDVTIQNNVVNFPVIKSAAVCRNLKELTNGMIKVYTGFSLLVAGKKLPPVIAPPSSSKLFITGTATPGGLMQAGDPELPSQQFTQVSNTLFEIPSIPLTGGGVYLFVPQYGDFSSKYGYNGTALTNNVTGDFFVANGSNILAPAASGNYHITVDFQQGKFSVFAALVKVSVPASAELYITGTATPGGLMANGAPALASQKFTKISSTVYEIVSIALTAGYYIFVPVYGSFSAKYGGIGKTNNSNFTAGDYFQYQGSNLLAPPISGNYKIHVDFGLGVFTLTQLP